MQYCDAFKDTRITLVGLGRLGRGIGDARFFAECDAELTVTDLKSEEELLESVAQLREYKNINFVLGEHRKEDFITADMVVQAPATPLDSPYIAAAKEAGVHVTMSAALAARYAREIGVTVVGVTGTRGKSTVSAMIHHVLRVAGMRTHLGGNVRGVSTLALLPELRQGDILVLELDSWQLQGFGYEALSPDVAVFTNFMPDHLNYYPNMETYFADKMHIATHQKQGDALIVGKTIAKHVQEVNTPATPQTPLPLSPDTHLAVPGEHNRENAALAVAALRALSVSEDDIIKALESFAGIEGRLEYLGERNSVAIYNDNNSTTPAATIAALTALKEKPIVLIAGGADKGLPLEKLAETVEKTCKNVFLLDGTGTKRLAPLLPGARVYDDFSTLMHDAFTQVAPGDTLLFSPAFASFGHFKNEYDRNDTFKKLLKTI